MAENLFSSFTWYELTGPITLFVLVVLSYLYVKKIILSKRYNVTSAQKKYFFSAVVFFYIFQGSPFTIIADHYLFSAHVLSLSVLVFVVPPLLILSIPTEFLRTYFWDYRMRAAIRLFAHPWVTALVFNGAVTLYFVPSVFNSIQESAVLSFLTQTFLFGVAILMWWTIIAPLPEVSKLSDFVRAAYVFCTAMLLMPIGLFLIVIEIAHYPIYEAVAQQLLPAITAIYDQQLAGGILKGVQLTSYGIALFHIIMKWGQKEEIEGPPEDEKVRVVQGVVIHLPDKK